MIRYKYVTFQAYKYVIFQASLTYAEAQMRIDDPKQNDDIAKSLRGLNKLAKILKQKRIEKGYEILIPHS